jgi:hypothetical protein
MCITRSGPPRVSTPPRSVLILHVLANYYYVFLNSTMPDPVPFLHRIEIAGSIAHLESDNPWLHASAAGLVLSAGHTDRYIDRALTETGEDLGGGSPRHWLFVFPAARHALSSVEFGIPHTDMTGQSADEARFDHEFAIDQAIALNQGNPAVDTLFSQIGGHVVEAVRKSGDDFLAGLEVRYAAREDNEVIRWVHVIYSRSLLNTSRILKEQMNRDGRHPTWMKRAVKPQNRKILAENMALSALAAARR